MMKPAFSTVACPEWTLTRVAAAAQASGFEAVELRTFGDASTRFACDPALSSPEKTRRLFGERGVEVLSLASGVRFDEPVRPPVIGHVISDTERSVRAGQAAVGLAVALECPFVRVFAFEVPQRERPAVAGARIVKRLSAVLDHAHNTGIRVVLENGGGFRTAAEVMGLLRRCDHPLLGVCYNLSVGREAGETPEAALDALGDRLWVARVKDHRRGVPCTLGQGEVPCEAFVRSLASRGFDGPLVYEWDRAWLPGLAPADEVLGPAAATLWSWLGGRVPAVAPAPTSKPAPPQSRPIPAAGGGKRRK